MSWREGYPPGDGGETRAGVGGEGRRGGGSRGCGKDRGRVGAVVSAGRLTASAPADVAHQAVHPEEGCADHVQGVPEVP